LQLTHHFQLNHTTTLTRLYMLTTQYPLVDVVLSPSEFEARWEKAQVDLRAICKQHCSLDVATNQHSAKMATIVQSLHLPEAGFDRRTMILL
jgi:hypothetical protein